ncbi:MAG: MarR family winged helix-turn-helix transcriptional regulator [Janthinobacterium lividum]
MKTKAPRSASAHGAEQSFILDRYVPGLLVWLSNKLSSSASQLYRTRFGLGVTDWRVLCYVELYPWSTGSQVCELIGLDKAAVSRSFSFLESEGLIKSRPLGGRRIEYASSPAGKKIYRKVLEIALDREDVLLKGFSKPERELLITFLQRLHENLPAVSSASNAD